MPRMLPEPGRAGRGLKGSRFGRRCRRKMGECLFCFAGCCGPDQLHYRPSVAQFSADSWSRRSERNPMLRLRVSAALFLVLAPCIPSAFAREGILTYCLQPLSGPEVKQISVVNADATDNRMLTHSPIGLNYPDWSPRSAWTRSISFPLRTGDGPATGRSAGGTPRPGSSVADSLRPVSQEMAGSQRGDRVEPILAGLSPQGVDMIIGTVSRPPDANDLLYRSSRRDCRWAAAAS